MTALDVADGDGGRCHGGKNVTDCRVEGEKTLMSALIATVFLEIAFGAV
ncbi:hypothetical protein P4G95_09425 [Burkholderia vietnamiensis]|nr:hypothetical protein [Burkholderia vietnamiensis]WHU93716.1 hypothetical protein P4G95_09425 [Burkholderia vietnamiensis]